MDKQLPPIPSRKYLKNLKTKNHEKQFTILNCGFKKDKSKASTICLYR